MSQDGAGLVFYQGLGVSTKAVAARFVDDFVRPIVHITLANHGVSGQPESHVNGNDAAQIPFQYLFAGLWRLRQCRKPA